MCHALVLGETCESGYFLSCNGRTAQDEVAGRPTTYHHHVHFFSATTFSFAAPTTAACRFPRSDLPRTTFSLPSWRP